MEEEYYENLIRELQEVEPNSDSLARYLVNYLTSKLGKEDGDDKLCETIVSITTVLSREDRDWVKTYIK